MMMVFLAMKTDASCLYVNHMTSRMTRSEKFTGIFRNNRQRYSFSFFSTFILPALISSILFSRISRTESNRLRMTNAIVVPAIPSGSKPDPLSGRRLQESRYNQTSLQLRFHTTLLRVHCRIFLLLKWL